MHAIANTPAENTGCASLSSPVTTAFPVQ